MSFKRANMYYMFYDHYSRSVKNSFFCLLYTAYNLRSSVTGRGKKPAYVGRFVFLPFYRHHLECCFTSNTEHERV